MMDKPMRLCAAVLALLLFAPPAAAQERFSLGLGELDRQLEDLPVMDSAPVGGTGGIVADVEDHNREALVYRSAMTPRSAKEFSLALWNAPMGRLYYSRAEAEAMLGREGLVNGGRMVGLGLGTTAIGDQSKSTLGFLASGGSWSELTLGQKFAAGAEASFLAAIIYALVGYAD